MDLDLRLVRSFVAVAEELHFGRAAARLYLTQPALSRQIRKLEEQVGGPLLERDSRHVALTARGERFLGDARELETIAQRLQRTPRSDSIRVAHVHELATSRDVCDAFAAAHPDVPMLEHALDSNAQLRALLEDRLDVAILRVTPGMLADHPRGWQHRLLRMEPFVVVAGRDDGETASLLAHPVEVFADPVESGTYSAHGQYLTALEQDLGVSFTWLGTPGAFSHCLARVHRADPPVAFLEFLTYGERYAEAGLRFRRPREVQPYYPWSIAWRDDETASTTHDLLRVALEVSSERGWLELSDHAPAWLPRSDPVRDEAFGRSRTEG